MIHSLPYLIQIPIVAFKMPVFFVFLSFFPLKTEDLSSKNTLTFGRCPLHLFALAKLQSPSFEHNDDCSFCEGKISLEREHDNYTKQFLFQHVRFCFKVDLFLDV